MLVTYPERRLKGVISGKVEVDGVFKPNPFFICKQVAKPTESVSNLCGSRQHEAYLLEECLAEVGWQC